jgi:hypothetical protein
VFEVDLRDMLEFFFKMGVETERTAMVLLIFALFWRVELKGVGKECR